MWLRSISARSARASCERPIAEWKEHQRIVSNRLPWGNHRGNDPLFGGVKLSNIAEPAYDYIR